MGGRGNTGTQRNSISPFEKLNQLEEIGYGGARTPIPLVSKSLGYKVQNIWEGLKSKEKKALPEETVDISNIKTWQTWVQKPGITRILENKNIEHQGKKVSPISAVKIGNDYVLMDGNHRVVAGLLTGQKKFKMRVYEYKGK